MPDLLPRQGFVRGEQPDDGGAVPDDAGQAAVRGEQRVSQCLARLTSAYLQL